MLLQVDLMPRADPLVIALAVFFVAFALALIFVAFWYHVRQDKQVRTDEEDEGFHMRPGEDDETLDEGEEPVEKGTERFRHG